MRRASAGLAALVLLAVAVAAHLTTPTRAEVVAPLVTGHSDVNSGAAKRTR